MQAYGFRRVEGNDCDEEKYGNYNDIDTAKKECKSKGKNCSAVFGIGCGSQDQFQLCRTNITKVSTTGCIHLKVPQGRNNCIVILGITFGRI